ncbi:MAG TPA: PTS sugar transporter subunit IIC [Clostridiaceae bacterium]|nr:PTS sugar transporter subunit IIC [Clostridiaceae bacterium]
MTVAQAILLALLGWMSSIYSPVLIGGLAGWYTLGRPLISGFVIGIIMGNIPGGIVLGAAIQMLYIGLVTPGGSMPADVNFAAWVGIPLALIAGGGTKYALALAVPLSFLGVAATYSTIAVNLYFVHRQDAYIDAGNLNKAAQIPIVGQITNFAFRFIPIFLADYYGSGMITKLTAMIPNWFNDILQVFANMLPLVGFTLLLLMIVKSNFDLIYFVFGFALTAVLKLSMVPIVIFAAVIAYINFNRNNQVPMDGSKQIVGNSNMEG